ncbi:beta strand repeat-containing protein [Chloroflexota bacterium]
MKSSWTNRKWTVVIAILTLMTLLWVIVPGCECDGADTGAISGTVKDSSGSAIVGATLTASSAEGSGSATTGDDGTYIIEDLLPSDTYSVTASATGYVSKTTTDIPVAAGVTTENINFVLQPPTPPPDKGAIAGQVKNASGAPVSGALVEASQGGTVKGSDTTAANGSYEIPDLLAGTYDVDASATGLKPGHQANIVVVAGQTTSGVDFVLATIVGSVAGTVTDASGAPVSGAKVSASLGGVVIESETTAANGSYTITNLPVGTYVVKADYPATSPLVSKQQTGVVVQEDLTTTVDFVLGGGISGTVTDAITGLPISGATVTPSQGSPDDTDADGIYTIVLIPAGTYGVTVEAAGYWDALLIGTPVTEGNITSNVDFALQPGGWIEGTVTEADGTTPVAGATVLATEAGGGFGQATTIADGTYVIIHLEAGTYTVAAQATGFISAQQTGVAVTAGATTADIDFALAQPGSISGTVTDAGGTGIVGATVTAFEVGGGYGTTTTGTGGTYQILNLPASDVYVVTAQMDNYATGEQNVVLADGEQKTGVDFALQGSGSISGTVTKPDGAAASGALVTATAAGVDSGSALTDSNGDYMISGLLPDANYTVAVMAAIGFELPAPYPTPVAVVAAQDTPDIDFVLLERGSMSGTVTDGTNPIEGATVIATSGADGGSGLATTNEFGDYSIIDLPEDSYSVLAQADGFITGQLAGVVVTAGTDTPGQDFALVATGSMSGTVTSASTGDPIEGATVIATDAVGGGLGSAITIADGTYLIEGLPASTTYTVLAEAPGTGYASAQQTGVTVVGGAETQDVDFALPDSGGIAGLVTEADGVTPVVGATVTATAQGIDSGYTLTDTNGEYQIDGLLPAITYSVSAEADGYLVPPKQTGITVAAGAVTSDIDFTLTKLGSISGTVTDGTNPVADVTVNVSEPGGGFGTDTTAPDGAYTIDGLLPSANYSVSATKTGYAAGAQSGVIVVAGADTVVDFTLTQGGSISGTVTDGTNPIVGATVTATASGIGGGSAVTADDGTYTIDKLPASTSYTVRVVKTGYATAAQTDVAVTVGVDTVIDFALTPVAQTGSISGTVTDAGGTAISGATVVAELGGVAVSVETGVDGTYQIDGLECLRQRNAYRGIICNSGRGNQESQGGFTVPGNGEHDG